MEIKNSLTMPKTGFEMRGNLAQKEPKILERWNNLDLYNKMLHKNENHQTFILHDGPPYANGDIHAGHALNKALKDTTDAKCMIEKVGNPPLQNITEIKEILAVAKKRDCLSPYQLERVEKVLVVVRRLKDWVPETIRQKG